MKRRAALKEKRKHTIFLASLALCGLLTFQPPEARAESPEYTYALQDGGLSIVNDAGYSVFSLSVDADAVAGESYDFTRRRDVDMSPLSHEMALTMRYKKQIEDGGTVSFNLSLRRGDDSLVGNSRAMVRYSTSF